MKSARSRAGFSLVELVVVIVIIGIIAAIAVPRISKAGKGAADSAVRGNLAVLRSAIDLYAAEHEGNFPGADNDSDTFVSQMTEKTNLSGATTGDDLVYGPYLRQGLPALPVGPNNNPNGIFIADTGPTVDTTKTDVGWIYNSTTGDIIANSDATDANGVSYDTY